MRVSFVNRWKYQTLEQMEFVLFSYKREKGWWFNGVTIIFVNFAVVCEFKDKTIEVVE